MQNEMFHVDMNVTMKPFDDKRVRQAIAYALPYEAIMKQALYDRAVPMWGADASKGYPPVGRRLRPTRRISTRPRRC